MRRGRYRGEKGEETESREVLVMQGGGEAVVEKEEV